jgi:hypothetical protein
LKREEIAGAAGKRCPGCNAVISINKDACQNCASTQAGLMQAKKGAPLAGSTHILISHESQDQEDLYRADGMLVASRQKDLVRFGHDIGTAQTRLFLNPELAKAWLKKLAEVDVRAHREGVELYKIIWQYGEASEEVHIEVRLLEKQLIIPATMKLN